MDILFAVAKICHFLSARKTSEAHFFTSNLAILLSVTVVGCNSHKTVTGKFQKTNTLTEVILVTQSFGLISLHYSKTLVFQRAEHSKRD